MSSRMLDEELAAEARVAEEEPQSSRPRSARDLEMEAEVVVAARDARDLLAAAEQPPCLEAAASA